jgi:hypothetical protein
MSARDAVVASGVPVPPGQLDWLHRHRFGHGGIDQLQPQTQTNLGAGTHGANLRHLTQENAVSHVVPTVGVVPVTTRLDNPISPAHHVFGEMAYVVHSPYDPSVAVSSSFDLLNPQMPRRPDQGYANLGMELFMDWATIHQLIESGAMTAADLGPGGPAQYEAWLRQHRQW